MDNRPARYQDDVPARSDVLQLQADRFAQQTSGPIASNRITNPSAGSETKTTVAQIIGMIKEDDQCVFAATTVLADLPKLLA